MTQKRAQVVVGVVVGGVVAALVGYDYLTRLQNERIEKQLGKGSGGSGGVQGVQGSRSGPHPQDKHVLESKQAINSLLQGLEHKSFREKVSEGYDGAVKTHDIGFPTTPTVVRADAPAKTGGDSRNTSDKGTR
jgi:hypothetical protein